MVWGDFQEGKNKTLGEELLRYQKKIMGMIEGHTGRFHADKVFCKLGILKVDDIYRHQLRIHAWKFSKDKLPESQTSMFSLVRNTHSYGTRASGRGLISYSAQDQRSIGYRIPKEWQETPQNIREANTINGMKKKSKQSFLSSYGSFECTTRNCFVCGRNAVNATGS